MRKQFKLEISVKIIEQGNWKRNDNEALAFSVHELIPAGVHPVEYVRQRLSEEIRRHANQVALETKSRSRLPAKSLT